MEKCKITERNRGNDRTKEEERKSGDDGKMRGTWEIWGGSEMSPKQKH